MGVKLLDIHSLIDKILSDLQDEFSEVKYFKKSYSDYYIYNSLVCETVHKDDEMRVYIYYRVYNNAAKIKENFNDVVRRKIAVEIGESLEPYIRNANNRLLKVEDFLCQLKESSMFDKVYFYFSRVEPKEFIYKSDEGWDVSLPEGPIKSTSYHLEKL